MNSVTTTLDPGLVRKYEVRGPRYTSYPTAPHFSPAFDEAAYRAAAESGRLSDPLSLYVHIPFCRTVCFYCACNKIITANYGRATHYLQLLNREAELLGPIFGQRAVRQLHLGGGTPTYLRSEDLQRLMESLRRNFNLSETLGREFSIEIDPRSVDEKDIAHLAQLGFNRMSLGVQDFDAAVQEATNRIQSVEQTASVLQAARAHGFRSTNLDLIYGLPRQTEASFRKTLDTVLELRPERLAIYAYAHLPEHFKIQRNILAAQLPDTELRLRLLEASVQQLTAAGYVYIGMDHFALPEDDLARAQREGTLHRNFQGYSTHADCDLVGLGVSAISSFGNSYAQNAKDVAGYEERLEGGRIPVVGGVKLTAEDLLRRDVIQSVMCHGGFDILAIEACHRIDFKSHFASELTRLQSLIDDGLVSLTKGRLRVTARGKFFLRNIAMIFDAYAGSERRPLYSKAI
jgi:oxygen-independent coproporphyrinogen-3 oxidase